MAMKNSTRIRGLFVMIILFIYPLPQLAIDIYLPSWPAMVHSLHASESLLQSSLTIYILFLGIAQLFYGPCSDKFGRKPTLLVGCSIFVISSIGCIFAKSIFQLLLFRALQGLGMGCGFAVASAVLADLFTGQRLAQMTSYSAIIYALAPILAPVVGGYLQYYIGWQANFLMMAIYALLLIILLYFFGFETNQQLNRSVVSPKKIIKNYLSFLSNCRFVGNIICLILVYGVMMVFNVVGPFLLQNILHVSEISYGQLLLLIGLSYLIGAAVNAYLLKYSNAHILINVGLGIMIISSLGLLIASFIHWFTPASVILFTCLSMLGIGFVYANCFANALEVFSEKGAVGAVIGSVVLIGTSIIGLIVTNMHVQHESALAYIYLSLAILSGLAYFVTENNSIFRIKLSVKNICENGYHWLIQDEKM